MQLCAVSVWNRLGQLRLDLFHIVVILMQAAAVLAVVALATPALGARELKQAVTDADIYNFALNLEYLEVSELMNLDALLKSPCFVLHTPIASRKH